MISMFSFIMINFKSFQGRGLLWDNKLLKTEYTHGTDSIFIFESSYNSPNCSNLSKIFFGCFISNIFSVDLIQAAPYIIMQVSKNICSTLCATRAFE